MRTGSPIPSRGPTIETRNQEDEIEHRRVDHRTPRQTWMNNNRIHMSPRVDNTACWPKGFEHGFMWVTTPCLKNTAFCACKAGQVLAGSKIHIPKIIRDPVASRAASPPPHSHSPSLLVPGGQTEEKCRFLHRLSVGAPRPHVWVFRTGRRTAAGIGCCRHRRLRRLPLVCQKCGRSVQPSVLRDTWPHG